VTAAEAEVHVPADVAEDFSWLASLEDDVDENFFTLESLEESPEGSTGRIHPVFAELQPWEQQIQNLSDAIPLTSPFDIAGLTQSRLDPFGALPATVNPSTEVLIDRCKSRSLHISVENHLHIMKFSPFSSTLRFCADTSLVQSTFIASWCPVSPASGWFAFAITDPALFHGTLFHWAAHKANASNGIDRDSPEILAHKLETMRLVNDRLGDPEQELKDETIAAVACLANVEVSLRGRTPILHGMLANII